MYWSLISAWNERESIELDNLINSSLAFCSKNLGSKKLFKIVVDKKNEIEKERTKNIVM